MNVVRALVLRPFPWKWARHVGEEIEIDAECAEVFAELGYLEILKS